MAFSGSDAQANGSFGMQGSCYVKLKYTADWQQRGPREDSDQHGYRSHVADRVQAADPIKHAPQYLRESRGDSHSSYQADRNGPNESPQHGGKYFDAIGPEREPYCDLFNPLRHRVANQTEQAHHCEKDRNAAQQADDSRNPFHRGDILAEAGHERGNGWIEPSFHAACNRLDSWRDSVRIASRPDQNRHSGEIIGRGRIVNLRRIGVVEFHGACVADHAYHDIIALLPKLSDWVFTRPALAGERLAEDDRVLFAVSE